MTVVQQNPTQHDDNYSPQSPEPTESSPVSTQPMNVSKFNSWETPHTTADNTFFPRTSQYESTGPLPWMKPSNRKTNPDESFCCPVRLRCHLLVRRRGS